jgi:hypothetical protein
VTHDTLADDYPVEAFMRPDGSAPLPHPSKDAEQAFAGRYALRVRTLCADLPVRDLRAGVNVLAVQIVRSAYREEPLKFHWWGVTGATIWSPGALLRATLTAPDPGGLQLHPPSPAAPRVWTAPALAAIGPDPTEGDRLAPLVPIRLQAPRNGVASGQAVVSAPRPVSGLKAEASDLKGPGGSVIPASGVLVRYARSLDPGRPNSWDVLADAPDGGTPLQPIWVTVSVPRSAAPGIYAGTLMITGLTPPIAIPIALRVHGWTLNDPKDWKTWAALMQSPETIAHHYQVPLWSDRHFALIEKSLALLGALGNKLAVVPVIPRTLTGKEAMVVFRDEGGRIVPDFRFARRYLELYGTHCGPPRVLCLQIWDTWMDGVRKGPPPPTLRLARANGERSAEIEAPAFGEPGSEVFWKTVVAGARDLVRSLGWDDKSLMLGLLQDGQIRQAPADFFARAFPDLAWVAFSEYGVMPPGPLGLLISPDQAGGHGSGKGWIHPRGHPNVTNHRNALHERSPLPAYRPLGLDALLRGYSGCGGFGIDYWPIAAAGDQPFRAMGHYSRSWGHVIRDGPQALSAPGPDGAIPTARYEVFREGLQEAEAFIAVETTIDRDALPPDVATRCKALRDRLRGKIDAVRFEFSDVDWWAEQSELYECASRVTEEATDK